MQPTATTRACQGWNKASNRGREAVSRRSNVLAARARTIVARARPRLSRLKPSGNQGCARLINNWVEIKRSGAPSTAEASGGNKVAGTARTSNTLPKDRSPKPSIRSAIDRRSFPDRDKRIRTAERRSFTNAPWGKLDGEVWSRSATVIADLLCLHASIQLDDTGWRAPQATDSLPLRWPSRFNQNWLKVVRAFLKRMSRFWT